MKQIRIYYTKLRNMGDQLNELILEKCFGYEASRCSFLEGEMCGIGSCLGMYTLHGTPLMRMRQRANGILAPKVSIWGTGFINYADCEGTFFKRDMKFCAVRGELTRKRVEQMTGKRLDIPTADGGILASEAVAERREKRYDVGIIPHLCDLKDPKVEELLKTYENARLISVKEDPRQVILEISECRTILSSSLHGLIIADSLGVPNLHVVFGDRLLGDGYKFDDYYSAYDIRHLPCDLRERKAPEIAEVRERYEITPEAVAEKKRQMREAFPFPAV